MFYWKRTVAALLSISCGALFAGTLGTVMEENNPRENLYVGLGVGGSFNQDQLKTSDLAQGGAVYATSHNNQWLGNALIGYGHTFAHALFLGIEANTFFPHRTENFYSPGVNDVGPIYQDQYTIKDYLSLDLLPGYRVNSNVLIYGRAGLSFRDVSINQPQNFSDSPSYFDSSNLIGGRFGAGLTYALNKHIAASVDYYYSSFPTFYSNWSLFDLKFGMQSHANYAGFSLLYTS